SDGQQSRTSIVKQSTDGVVLAGCRRSDAYVSSENKGTRRKMRDEQFMLFVLGQIAPLIMEHVVHVRVCHEWIRVCSFGPSSTF
ncbi:hypothetical protein L195_g035861, partial [Trifolium pratense]